MLLLSLNALNSFLYFTGEKYSNNEIGNKRKRIITSHFSVFIFLSKIETRFIWNLFGCVPQINVSILRSTYHCIKDRRERKSPFLLE